MSRLAAQHQSVNLGQGFPDDEGPESMKKVVGSAVIDYHNQYPPLLGLPELRQAVAAHSKRYTGLKVDWQTQTLVTVGATEALAAAFMGLMNPGDEASLYHSVCSIDVPMTWRRAFTLAECSQLLSCPLPVAVTSLSFITY